MVIIPNQEAMNRPDPVDSEFAERYFRGLLAQDRPFAGMHFDKLYINQHYNEMREPEGKDIILTNEKYVVIVETKLKARDVDIVRLIARSQVFRSMFPMHKRCKLYLGLAPQHITNTLLEKVKRKGFAIIRPKGEMVMVWDRELREY